MNDSIHSCWEPEKAHNFMEWEEDSGIESLDAYAEEVGTSSVDPNIISKCLNSQPSASEYIGQKRKSHFSSPLATKISRNIWYEEQQQEDPLSVNKIDLQRTNEVAPASSIVAPVYQMMLDGDHNILSSVTSDNHSAASVSDCKDSSNFHISAYAIDNTCTAACQSRTCDTYMDLNMVKRKIILHAEGQATYRKEKPFSCNFCCLKWPLESNVQRLLTCHAADDRVAVREHFSIQEHQKSFRCFRCGMFFSTLKQHSCDISSSDSDS